MDGKLMYIDEMIGYRELQEQILQQMMDEEKLEEIEVQQMEQISAKVA